MAFSTKLAATVAGGFLMIAAYAPAWAGAADSTPTTTQSVSGEPSFLSAVTPLLNPSTPHAAQKPCSPDSLYSAHDVVGDSQSCFMSKVDVRGSALGNGGFSGAL